jgi:two-component system sensor histidine kinase TtrS
MQKKFVFPVMVLSVLLTIRISTAQESYKIGVLAKNGPVRAMKMWKATGDYLASAVSGKRFEVIPLSFDEVDSAIQNRRVDFFLINSSMFITAKVKFGASAIATMINSRQEKPLKSFGGVILSDIGNDEINTIQDLKDKNFMAVKESSFGGWQMAYMEFLASNIDPMKDFAKLVFSGKHENVILSIQNGAADAGTVRTDTLERMAAIGIVETSDFKIIAPKHHDGFPFVCSTPLYPEWPFAKTKDTPDTIAAEVANALKQMESKDKAAKDAKIVGWVDPLDYTPVEALQKTLKVGAYTVHDDLNEPSPALKTDNGNEE